MKKTKIRIDKIYQNKVQTKFGEKDKFTLMFKKFGFTGWGVIPENYKQGAIVEIEYDELSKYNGQNATYYNLIQPTKTNKDNMEIRIILNTILSKVERIENAVCREEIPEVGDEEQETDEIPIIDEQPIDPPEFND